MKYTKIFKQYYETVVKLTLQYRSNCSDVDEHLQYRGVEPVSCGDSSVQIDITQQG